MMWCCWSKCSGVAIEGGHLGGLSYGIRERKLTISSTSTVILSRSSISGYRTSREESLMMANDVALFGSPSFLPAIATMAPVDISAGPGHNKSSRTAKVCPVVWSDVERDYHNFRYVPVEQDGIGAPKILRNQSFIGSVHDVPAKSFTTINKYKCSSRRVFGIGKLIPKFLEVSPSLIPREKLLQGWA
eukprot:scaffold36297_cov63-Attheya_sp.AAC.4